MFDKLIAEFPRDNIHWRAQTLTSNGDKALALAYLDARDVMDRLDAVCGPENWQDSYIESSKGRIICTISIRCNGEWVSKSDGAGDTAVEGEKGGISDAFKRAAVKWGIGRYLYRLDAVWAACETYERNGKKVWKAWRGSPWQFVRGFEGPSNTSSNEPPQSVVMFMEGLRKAFDEGSTAVTEYWTKHWAATDNEWRPYLIAEKDKLKAGHDLVDVARAA